MEEEPLSPVAATPEMIAWESMLAVLGKMHDNASMEAKRAWTRAYKAQHERDRRARAKQHSDALLSQNAAA